jgi:hypothetical protein
MARSRSCRACGGWHDVAEPWPSACVSHFGVVGADAPYVRTDGMDPIRSMADGKIYDSKSGYYQSVRRADCEIVGNDRAGFGPRPEFKPQGVAQSIKKALAQHGMGD